MAQPQVVFGAGHVHITQIKDALGNTLTPPQVIAAPAVNNISADFGKADVKLLYGQKEFALHAAQGKKTVEVSFECGELHAKMLNGLYFGQSLTEGSNSIYRDTAGTVVPDNSYTASLKVRNNKVFKLSKVLGVGTVKIGNASTVTTNANATESTDDVIAAGQFKYSNGVYTFSAADRASGLKAQITTTVPGSATTTVVTTITIPASLSFNTALYEKRLSLTNAGTALTNETYNVSSTSVTANKFQSNSSGVYAFNSAAGQTALVITHTTDGTTAISKIASLPATGYVTFVSPSSLSVYGDTVSVMDGSTRLSNVVSGPDTGEYAVATYGMFTFAAADAGNTITINYTLDAEHITVNPPNSGEFVADKGVRSEDGMPLTRVSLAYPISLAKGQYAVSTTGDYYFDNSNNGDTVYIDYEYSSTDGVTLAIANNDMGSTPIVSLDISGVAEGQEWLIKYPKAVPKAFGFATKLDDFGTYKISYDVVADRVSGKVGTVYMTG